MAETYRPAVNLPLPPQQYDPRDQAELRRLVMNALDMAVENTMALVVEAKVLDTDATTTTIRVGVSDPEPQGTNSASIAYTYTVSTGPGTVDKTSPQTVTPEATLAYAAGTYCDFVVTKPAVGTGTWRITFTATAQGRQEATDSVDVSAADLVYNECFATVTASDADTVTVTVTAASLTGTPTVGLVAVRGCTLSSGHTAGTYTYAQNGTDNVWVFARGTAAAGVGQVQFRALLSGNQSDDDFVIVPALDLVYNECRATVTASDATTVTVTVTAVSVSGSPTVGFVGLTGVGGLSAGHAAGTYTYAQNGSDNVWVFTRGASGSGVGQAQFRAVLAGNETDDDFVTIPDQTSSVSYVQCNAVITGTDTDTVTVTVTATAIAGTPTVGLVALSGSATLGAGHAAGTYTYAQNGTDNVWTFVRGSIGAGLGYAQFRAIYSGAETDDDYATINEQGRDTAPLMIRARVTEVTASTVVVRVAVADAYPQGPDTAIITYYEENVGAATTPASGEAVTPESTLNQSVDKLAEDGVTRLSEGGVTRHTEEWTEPPPTYRDYTITRPAFGMGAGRVTFTARATDRTEDSDAVDIPEVNRDTVYLAMRAHVTASTATTVTVRVAVADPICATDPQAATITYTESGTGGVSPASGSVVTPEATLTEAAGTYVDYTITRPAFKTGAGRVTFTATAAHRTSDADAVDIPEVGRDTVYLSMRAHVTNTSATAITVRVSVADPICATDPQTATVTYQNYGTAGVTPASGGTVTPAATFTGAAGTYIDYTITRPAFKSGGGRVTFTCTATNRTADSDSVDVPAAEQDTVYSECRATVSASTDTTISVTVTAVSTLGTPSVHLVGVTGTAVLYSGPAIGATGQPSGTVWVFTRGSALGGSGQVQFRATMPDTQTDDDFVVIPEIGQDTRYLVTRAHVTTSNNAQVVVRVYVADPYPQGANSATITYESLGTGGVTPASGQTVTPAATITEGAGTYCDFTVTRPAATAGTGRVTFTATAANRVIDSDSVDIPAKEVNNLIVTLVQTASTGFSDPGAGSYPTVTLTMTVTDPAGLLTGNANVVIGSQGIQSLYNNTLSAAAVTFNATIGTTYTFTATLYKSAAGGGFIKFTATKAGGYDGHATFWCSSAWAEASSDTIITIGSNETGVTTAKASLIVNTVENADSMRWAASKTDYPTKATTLTANTPVTLGPPFLVTDLGVDLSFGDTVYVTVLLYDYAGVLMDRTIHAKATRSNLSKLKTLQWAAASHFHPYTVSKTTDGSWETWRGTNSVCTTERSMDEVFLRVTGPGAGLATTVDWNAYLTFSFVLADGGTMKSQSAEVWEDSVSDGAGHFTTVDVTVDLYASSVGAYVAAGSPISTLYGSSTGGWETVTPSTFSQSTTGKRFVVTATFFSTARYETSVAYGKIRSYTITYLPGDLQSTV